MVIGVMLDVAERLLRQDRFNGLGPPEVQPFNGLISLHGERHGRSVDIISRSYRGSSIVARRSVLVFAGVIVAPGGIRGQPLH